MKRALGRWASLLFDLHSAFLFMRSRVMSPRLPGLALSRAPRMPGAAVLSPASCPAAEGETTPKLLFCHLSPCLQACWVEPCSAFKQLPLSFTLVSASSRQSPVS